MKTRSAKIESLNGTNSTGVIKDQDIQHMTGMNCTFGNPVYVSIGEFAEQIQMGQRKEEWKMQRLTEINALVKKDMGDYDVQEAVYLYFHDGEIDSDTESEGDKTEAETATPKKTDLKGMTAQQDIDMTDEAISQKQKLRTPEERGKKIVEVEAEVVEPAKKKKTKKDKSGPLYMHMYHFNELLKYYYSEDNKEADKGMIHDMVSVLGVLHDDFEFSLDEENHQIEHQKR